MNAINEYYEAYKANRKAVKARRFALANSQLEQAKSLMRNTQITISSFPPFGFRFESESILFYTFPTSQRISIPNENKRPPWMYLPNEWGLIDIANELLNSLDREKVRK